MIWINFTNYALVAIALWMAALIMIYIPKQLLVQKLGIVLSTLGTIVLGIFLVKLWIGLERPPMRTLGETRLWYSLFLPFIGIVTYIRWKYKWFLAYSLGLSSLFLIINIAKPETYDQTLMPALQSPWFVPHVIVYIFAYALLAASSLIAVKGLWNNYKGKEVKRQLQLGDNLVYIGFSFLSLGLIFGALWAKEAWGHYWTWDPKETWAFLTWIAYLIYIHFRYQKPKEVKVALWILSVAFIVLLLCWFGVNYMPSAANSVHTYTS